MTPDLADFAGAASDTRLRLLANLGGALLTAEDPDVALRRFLADAPPGMGLDMVFSYAADVPGRTLRLTHGHGVGPELAASLQGLPFGDMLCGRVAETRAPLFVFRLQDTVESAAEAARGLGVRAYAGFPLFGAGGALLGVLGFVSLSQDSFDDDDVALLATVAHHVAAVRDRLQAAEAARNGEARFRAVFEQAGVGMALVRADGTFARVNQRLCAMLGYGPDTLRGLSTRELTHPDDCATDLASLAALKAGEASVAEWEKRFLHRDGRAVWVHLTVSLERDEAGGPVQYIAAVNDITERKRTEQRLAERDALVRAVLESTEELIYAKDLDGRYLVVSRATAALHGRPARDCVGLTDQDLFPPDVAACLRDHDMEVVRGGRMERFEEQAMVDGSLQRFQSTKAPLVGPDGRCFGVVGVSVNVTERQRVADELFSANRRAEAALLEAEAAKEEAEEANRAKSRFLASASHDLRQPVQAMMLFAGVLEGAVADGPGAEALTHLTRGLDVLKGMLDGLLDVSRLEAGAVAPDLQAFGLGGLLAELAAAYGAVAEAKGLSFEVSGCEATVRSDRVLLGRMLRNLLENAMRYTEPGGTVRLLCEHTPCGAHLSVMDTGVGIPDAHQQRIFDEFHQVGNTGRNREEGLGLGLAIVKRLSRLLDHPVRVQSTVGVGSTFSVDLPCEAVLRQVPVPQEVQEPEPVLAGAGRLALVVDDDAIVLLGLKQMLEGMGWAVVMAADPEQAEDRVRKAGNMPDLVLTDYRLRDGRVGTEAVALVRGITGRVIPGFVLTGEAGPEAAADAAAHGLGLIHKPVTPRQLANALSGLVEHG